MELKRTVKNSAEFIKKLKNAVKYCNETKLNSFYLTLFSTEEEIGGISKKVIIQNKKFTDQRWPLFSFDVLEFHDCIFQNISFDTQHCYGCIFQKCEFIGCRFQECTFHETEFINCKFSNSKFERSIFGDCFFIKNTFLQCKEIYDTYFGSCYFEENSIISCLISFCRFESLLLSENENTYHIIFLTSELTGTAFNSFNLSKTIFRSCILSKNSFSNTPISNGTFNPTNICEKSNYSLIDLHSLAASDTIHPLILDTIFGIKEPDIKTYSIGMIQDIKLQSVFISYSFMDKDFANKLNDALKRKGVFTFLWEKNAPGGKRLKSIMSESINSYDRVLFIASENSLKSEACHFELTQARLKQDQLWKTIFIPIHVDNFLFFLNKDDIRPEEKREEYWKNVQDLKSINSLDFTKFKSTNDLNEEEFESHVYKLIQCLRK